MSIEIDYQNIFNQVFEIPLERHRFFQRSLVNTLENLGFSVKTEYGIFTPAYKRKQGYIDLVAKNNNGFVMGIEIDRAKPKLYSIEKLRTLNPGFAIFLLKGKRVKKEPSIQRTKSLTCNYAIIDLLNRKILYLSDSPPITVAKVKTFATVGGGPPPGKRAPTRM